MPALPPEILRLIFDMLHSKQRYDDELTQGHAIYREELKRCDYASAAAALDAAAERIQKLEETISRLHHELKRTFKILWSGDGTGINPVRIFQNGRWMGVYSEMYHSGPLIFVCKCWRGALQKPTDACHASERAGGAHYADMQKLLYFTRAAVPELERVLGLENVQYMSEDGDFCEVTAEGDLLCLLPFMDWPAG